MTTNRSLVKISRDLVALEKGEILTWAQIGTLLAEVDHSGYWRTSAGSFTEWLKTISPSLKLKEASLWRYYTAARYYQELHKILIDKNVTIPPLAELLEKVSAENIEILSKLARVMPDSVFLRLAKQVVAGFITRAELRNTWLAYRPVLLGRTARGRGVAVPKFNPSDSNQFDSMLGAQVFTALSASGSEWTGVENPDRYQLFTNVGPEFPADVRKRIIFDAVVTLRAHNSDPLMFHGIVIIVSHFVSSTYDLLEQLTPYCDFLWIATHGSKFELGKLHLPEHVGLIVAVENAIQVILPAQRTKQSGRYTGELAKGLLLKILSR